MLDLGRTDHGSGRTRRKRGSRTALIPAATTETTSSQLSAVYLVPWLHRCWLNLIQPSPTRAQLSVIVCLLARHILIRRPNVVSSSLDHQPRKLAVFLLLVLRFIYKCKRTLCASRMPPCRRHFSRVTRLSTRTTVPLRLTRLRRRTNRCLRPSRRLPTRIRREYATFSTQTLATTTTVLAIQ